MTSPTGGYPADAFARLARVETGNYWFESRNRLIVWALGKFFPAATSFLEIGCGTGFVLQAIHRAKPAITLTAGDFHEEALPFVRARVPSADIKQIDARQLDGSAQYDVVGAFDVLEHIGEDDLALKGIWASTRPGGGLLITVPQHQWLWSPTDDLAQHVRRYSRAELSERVRAAGFEPVFTTSFVSLLLPALIVSRRRMVRQSNATNAEFAVSPAVNALLSAVLWAERVTIRAGLSLPAGGSLLMAARRR